MNNTSKNVLVTGATGFVGQTLCRALIKQDYYVIVLTRDYLKAFKIFGTDVLIVTDLNEIQYYVKFNAIISLAGAPVVGGLWTKKRKQLLIDSRLNDLKSIKAMCKRLNWKPKVLINASAIGYYGIRQDELITEQDKGQDIFQSILCQTKENSALDLQEDGVRVCNLRMGLVFDQDGGAFPQMTCPIKLGLGAVFGKGQQWMSWISKSDLIRIIIYLIENKDLSGAINATAPEPITNTRFTQLVASHYKRQLFFKAPAFVLKTILGELSQLFLEGQRVIPEKLLASGFKFEQSSFEALLSVIDEK